MSKATQLVAKVDKILKRFTPLDRTVYKRVITRTGGDDLIGRAGSIVTVDTVFDPQPYYSQIGRERVTGKHAAPERITTPSGVDLTADDYEFLFSPTALAVPTVALKNLQIVLKDSLGATEVLDILDTTRISAYSGTIVITVFARSTKRQ